MNEFGTPMNEAEFSMVKSPGKAFVQEQLAQSGMEMSLDAATASLIGGAVSFVGSIFGGNKAANAAREQARLANEAAERRLWYNTELWEMDAHRLVANRQQTVDTIEAAARNEGRLAQWKDASNAQKFIYDLQIRNREQASNEAQFKRSTQIFNTQMSLNAIAAASAEDDELRKLDEIQDEASFSRQEAGLEALRAEGKLRARGIEGRSVAKARQDIKADYGRQMAMLNASMDSAGQETRSVLKEIARDKASADLSAYANKMLDPGVLPMPMVPFKTPRTEFILPRELGEYDFGPEPVLGAYTSPNAAASQVWGQVLPSIASSAGTMVTAALTD